MARPLATAALLLAVSTGIASSSDERLERPHIVVHKHLLTPGLPDGFGFLVKGKAFKAVYTVRPWFPPSRPQGSPPFSTTCRCSISGSRTPPMCA